MAIANWFVAYYMAYRRAVSYKNRGVSAAYFDTLPALLIGSPLLSLGDAECAGVVLSRGNAGTPYRIKAQKCRCFFCTSKIEGRGPDQESKLGRFMAGWGFLL
jgi:hypothetical protein